MAEGKGTPTPEQEKEPEKLPPWWKRLWARTGFGDKTLWDVLQLLIVPLVLVGIGLLFEMQQAEREERRATSERNLVEQRAQDEALQAYLNQMSSLLLEKDLRASEKRSEARTLARARTLTVLGRLDPSRRTQVMSFLVEADLVAGSVEVMRLEDLDLAKSEKKYFIEPISGTKITPPIISLRGANLQGVNLSDVDLANAGLQDANLEDTNLQDANLQYANLEEAYLANANLENANLENVELRRADLSGANLEDTNLSGFGTSFAYAELNGATLDDADGISNEELHLEAASLEGATMPNGQKYEEWLKDKEDHR